jgi:hypothetical protein
MQYLTVMHRVYCVLGLQGAQFFTQVKTVTTNWDYNATAEKLSMVMPTPGRA